MQEDRFGGWSHSGQLRPGVGSLKGEFLGEGRAGECNCHEQGGKLFHDIISFGLKPAWSIARLRHAGHDEKTEAGTPGKIRSEGSRRDLAALKRPAQVGTGDRNRQVSRAIGYEGVGKLVFTLGRVKGLGSIQAAD